MIIFKTIQAVQLHLTTVKNNAQKIGFVPTMGALHNGHISLIEASLQQQLYTVCSIFVNPTQFNNAADFEKYPITLEADIVALEKAGCHVLFLPSVQEIYPTHYIAKNYNLGFLETVLEGQYRPGHFQGVCQVVHILLDAVKPNIILMGQKDYQQCMVIQRLLQLENLPISLQIIATQRAESGLALSSRNMRLSEKGLQQATAIYNCFTYIHEQRQYKNFKQLQQACYEILLQHQFSSIDYIAFCHPTTLESLVGQPNATSFVVLIAAFLEDVRLIDNMVFN